MQGYGRRRDSGYLGGGWSSARSFNSPVSQSGSISGTEDNNSLV